MKKNASRELTAFTSYELEFIDNEVTLRYTEAGDDATKGVSHMRVTLNTETDPMQINYIGKEQALLIQSVFRFDSEDELVIANFGRADFMRPTQIEFDAARSSKHPQVVWKLTRVRDSDTAEGPESEPSLPAPDVVEPEDSE